MSSYGSSVTSGTVTAVVVTYRRKLMLQRCVAALLSQTRPPDRILVVDNGGDVEPEDLVPAGIPDSTITIERLLDNTGPAGGFERGIARAVREGAEWVWLMDDDVIAEPKALEVLLGASRPDAINWPLVLDESGKESIFPAWAGLLVHEKSVRRAGLPRADLFWWAEDTEFIRWRLQRGLRMAPLIHRGAIVHHLHPARHRVKPAWKYYYEVRNEIFVGLKYKKRKRYWRIPRNLVRQIARIIVVDRRDVFSKLSLVGLGVRHGLTGRLGKLVDPSD